MDQDQANPLLAHAADCSECGARLNDASAALSGEITASEEQFLNGLESSSVAWQESMADRLVHESAPVRRRPSLLSRPIFWAAASALAAGVAVLTFWLYSSHQSTDALLAVAYDQERLTELRVPGGKPVPLHSPVRSNNPVEDVPELLEARLRVERALKADPESARWNQMLGRVLVIEMRPKEALDKLLLAQTKNPGLDRIQFDVGTAQFELGRFGEAADSFSGFINSRAHPDPIALFDRALCWEKVGTRELAIRDLNAALNVEQDGAWRDAIKSKLRELGGSARSVGPGNGTTSEGSDLDGYESQLQRTIEQGMTLNEASQRRKIDRLVEAGRVESDYWLSDWRSAELKHEAPGGNEAIAEALREERSGHCAQSLASATLARHLYSEAGNRAGVLLASREIAYSERRIGRPEESLRVLSESADRGIERYPSIEVSVLLERGASLALLARFDEALMQLRHAKESAQEHHLREAAAKASGYIAGVYTTAGRYEDGWRSNSEGLIECNDSPCLPMQRYQYVSDLALDAHALNLDYIAALLAAESAKEALNTGNDQIAAYAFELQGKYRLEIRDASGAEESFRTADQLLLRISDMSAVRTYRADWASDRASLLSSETKYDAAIHMLEESQSAIEGTETLAVRLNYWTNRARIEADAGKDSLALRSVRQAEKIAWKALHDIKGEEARSAWLRETRDTWLTLISCLAGNSHPKEALAVWTVFRNAEAREPDPLRGLATSVHPASSGPSDSPSLTYVRLRRKYLALVLDKNSDVYAVELPSDPRNIEQLARVFRTLASDPRSSLAEVRSVGREMYAALIAPVMQTIPAELRIDTPDQLAGTPFAAFVEFDGTYLGSHAAVVQVEPGWASRAHWDGSISNASRLLLVDASRVEDREVTPIPGIYNEAPDVASGFARVDRLAGSQANLDALLDKLRSADVFHFIGHGATNDEAGLVLNDQNLTAYSLQPQLKLHCRIAVLSSCRSAGEMGADPFRRDDVPNALLRAGVSEVLASHWDVDSEATRLLMQSFYENLLKGKSAPVSLQIAEEAVSTSPPFHHPFYWSAFWIQR
jgi:CHAT domain-containing protein